MSAVSCAIAGAAVLLGACGGDDGGTIAPTSVPAIPASVLSVSSIDTETPTDLRAPQPEVPTGPAGPVPVEGVPAPIISAGAAVVIDGDSLAVLYEHNAYQQREPASLTKIATAILVAENASMEAVFTSDVHHWELEWDSSTMGLEPGDQLTVRDLLLGLMLVSGNDAAIVLGRHIAGNDAQFVDALNALALRLGLTDTHFMNPHGFSERGHYSSAHDMAMLARHLMSIPALREVVGTEVTTVTGTGADGQERTFNLYNHNPLLNYTPGVDGVKTGFTERAGRTFAASVERDGHRIYVIILDAPTRAEDAILLIEWAYAAWEWPQ
ncbi:MAG: D-alanyl-D-alanine carboxypeptidase [Chloroflexi bacterium]|nr:D-alanyl-D-alanine carboxypeptidase [Chloroflexota bacterium]